jgi:hypothetical protein
VNDEFCWRFTEGGTPISSWSCIVSFGILQVGGSGGDGGGGGGSNAAGNNQQNTLNQLRLQLANALANDPDCLSFLQGKSGGAPNVLDSIPIDIQNVGSAGIQAVTEVNHDPGSLAPQNPAIHVNSNGLFFVRGLGAQVGDTLVGTGTPLFQAITMYHELGHATGALPGDSRSADTSHQNSDRVAEHCKKALSNFPNK